MPSDGSHPLPRLRVSVVDDDGRPVRAPALAAWLARVAPARARGSVTIALVRDRRVRTLNRQYRGIDRATDVLSFPAGETRGGRRAAGGGRLVRVAEVDSQAVAGHGPGVRPRRPAFLGDIVIARGVAARQAREAGHAERTEWRVLALHGLLHLIGYDHEHDAGEMRRAEARLRRKGGLDAGLIEREGAQ
jgi:probable rRNA maturation factor